jgi:hypothetical protein
MQGRLDCFDGGIEGLIDMRKPLAVLATRMPWAEIEAVLAPVPFTVNASICGQPDHGKAHQQPGSNGGHR